MPQITLCPHCQRQLQVQDAHLGQTIKCPLCGGLFAVAAPPAVPPVVEVEVVQPPAAPHIPPPPPRSSALRKPPSKPAQKVRPTPAPAPPVSVPAPVPAAPADPFAQIGSGSGALKFDDSKPEPHRGGLVLGLGLAGFLLSCCFPLGFILGGIAASMGGKDIHLMARARMDRAGKGMTQAGRILGIVAIIFSALSLAGWVWQLSVNLTRVRF